MQSLTECIIHTIPSILYFILTLQILFQYFFSLRQGGRRARRLYGISMQGVLVYANTATPLNYCNLSASTCVRDKTRHCAWALQLSRRGQTIAGNLNEGSESHWHQVTTGLDGFDSWINIKHWPLENTHNLSFDRDGNPEEKGPTYHFPFGFPILLCLVNNKSLFSEFGLNGHDDWAKNYLIWVKSHLAQNSSNICKAGYHPTGCWFPTLRLPVTPWKWKKTDVSSSILHLLGRGKEDVLWGASQKEEPHIFVCNN